MTNTATSDVVIAVVVVGGLTLLVGPLIGGYAGYEAAKVRIRRLDMRTRPDGNRP